MLLTSPALAGKHGGKKYDVKCRDDEWFRGLPPSEYVDIYTHLIDYPTISEKILKVDQGRSYTLEDKYTPGITKVCITNMFFAYGTTVSFAEIGRGVKRIYEKCCDKRDGVMCRERSKAQITGRDGLYLDVTVTSKPDDCPKGPVDYLGD